MLKENMHSKIAKSANVTKKLYGYQETPNALLISNSMGSKHREKGKILKTRS
jgi:hypothetical protein